MNQTINVKMESAMSIKNISTIEDDTNRFMLAVQSLHGATEHMERILQQQKECHDDDEDSFANELRHLNESESQLRQEMSEIDTLFMSERDTFSIASSLFSDSDDESLQSQDEEDDSVLLFYGSPNKSSVPFTAQVSPIATLVRTRIAPSSKANDEGNPSTKQCSSVFYSLTKEVESESYCSLTDEETDVEDNSSNHARYLYSPDHSAIRLKREAKEAALKNLQEKMVRVAASIKSHGESKNEPLIEKKKESLVTKVAEMMYGSTPLAGSTTSSMSCQVTFAVFSSLSIVAYKLATEGTNGAESLAVLALRSVL